MVKRLDEMAPEIRVLEKSGFLTLVVREEVKELYQEKKITMEGVEDFGETIPQLDLPRWMKKKADAEFKHHSTRSRDWSCQLNEVPRLMGHSDEKRFSNSGMAQAILLDRLSPGWKQQILSPGVSQEDLLRRAVSN